ncbi:hypothetical protein [Demequina sp. NBRC 110055]|uniref:hypothetical protein n=1 Tax=Demequina sp. NBRC 110055 TaxID=1570344 RepID=UPI001185E709|nr:hypothetical protein [Demequina sp. NBRC 110055]
MAVVVIFIATLVAWGLTAEKSACDETRSAYSRWKVTDSEADYATYRAWMAKCAADGYED